MKDLVDFIKSFDMHTIIIVGVAFLWFSSGINSRLDIIQKDFSDLRSEMNDIKRDMAVIKAVLVMRNLMPSELCKHEDLKK